MRPGLVASALALALALPLALGPRVARADDLKQAKMYFDAGAQAYSAGRYAVAVSAFDLAYKLAPRPAILFSMAQAERKQWLVSQSPDVIRSAVRHYHDYLAVVPTGGRRADATEALGDLEPALARLGGAASAAPGAAPPEASPTRLMISSPVAGATASIDGAAMAETPLMEKVAPGKHQVTVQASGYFDETRDVVALAGTIVPAEVALREKPARLAVAAPDDADVLLDGRAAGTTPLSRPLEVAPGAHLVTVSKNGYGGYSREVSLERDKTTTLDVHFRRTTQRAASYGVFGAGLTAIVAGGVFAGVSLAEQSSAQGILNDKAHANISSTQRDAYARDVSLRDGWRTAAVATLATGVGLLGVAAALYAFDRPGPSEPPPL